MHHMSDVLTGRGIVSLLAPKTLEIVLEIILMPFTVNAKSITKANLLGRQESHVTIVEEKEAKKEDASSYQNRFMLSPALI